MTPDLQQENALLRLELAILRGQTEAQLRDEHLRAENQRLQRLIDAERRALVRNYLERQTQKDP